MSVRSGVVSILGRPNVGKSTLLNRLAGQKIAITTPKPQTTRSLIRGILSRDDAQIVFVDTPGIHQPKELLGREMVREAWESLDGVDVVYLMIDARRGWTPADQRILDRLEKEEPSRFLVVNKIDAVSKAGLLKLLDQADASRFAEIVPVSAQSGENTEELIRATIPYLPNEGYLFPKEVTQTQPERFQIAEIIREKLMMETGQEIPHTTAVIVESVEFHKESAAVYAVIYVEKSSQKGIVIGRGGQMLKKIGTQARPEIEKLLGKKVFLQLYVRVEEDWRNRIRLLKELGYTGDGE